jgi:hypothetical protein
LNNIIDSLLLSFQVYMHTDATYIYIYIYIYLQEMYKPAFLIGVVNINETRARAHTHTHTRIVWDVGRVQGDFINIIKL